MGERAYLYFKLLHVLGAVLFPASLALGLTLKRLADGTNDPRVVGFAQRVVVFTDAAFAAPGALLLFVSGLLMIVPYGVSFWRVPWLLGGLALAVAATGTWLFALVPLQLSQARLAREFRAAGEIPAAYWRLERLWLWLDVAALFLSLATLALMVLKPA